MVESHSVVEFVQGGEVPDDKLVLGMGGIARDLGSHSIRVRHEW